MRALLLAFLFAGCAVQQPIIDLTGVDMGQYSRDLAWCNEHPPPIGFGNYVSKCMEQKGYTILVYN